MYSLMYSPLLQNVEEAEHDKCGFHNSPVNLGMFEAQHQSNCNRIVFNAIE